MKHRSTLMALVIQTNDPENSSITLPITVRVLAE